MSQKDLFERRVEWAVAKADGPGNYGIPQEPPVNLAPDGGPFMSEENTVPVRR